MNQNRFYLVELETSKQLCTLCVWLLYCLIKLVLLKEFKDACEDKNLGYNRDGSSNMCYVDAACITVVFLCVFYAVSYDEVVLKDGGL